jgi:hypothetical protein
MDRRALFFFVAAVITGALERFVPHDPKHPLADRMGWPLTIALVVLGVLSLLDHASRARRRN